MTLDTLRRWTLQPGISADEASERRMVAHQIFASNAVDAVHAEKLLAPAGASTAGVSRYTLLKWRLNGLEVKGDLNLDGLQHITSLPDGLVVRGHCSLIGCPALRALPHALVIGGDLTLDGCASLQYIDAQVDVGGALTLSGCSSLETLPPTLKKVGHLCLLWGNAVAHLPQDFTVGGDLTLLDCETLVGRLARLQTHGNFTMEGCRNVVALSEGTQVGQSMYLGPGNALTSTPPYLRVGQDLDLEGDGGISTLGEHLQVGGNMRIVDSPTFGCLPSIMKLGGNLILHGCRLLNALPEYVTALGARSNGQTRIIDVRGTSVPLERMLYMRDHQAFGMRFMFTGLPFSKQHALHLMLAHFELQAYASQVTGWQEPQSQVLRRYLQRARRTADYKNPRVRIALFERLRAVVEVSCRNVAFRDRALALLEGAMTSCGDRVIQGLDQVELALALDRAQEGEPAASKAALHALGLKIFKLQIVHSHAAASCRNMSRADEVEVYLAYETQLRKRLDLPGSTVFTLYGSGVVPQDIEAAARDAEARSTDGVSVARFMETWGPWQRLQRREQADARPFADIDTRVRSASEKGQKLICPITQISEQELDEPVYVGEAAQLRVYNYGDLITWWVEHGTEPATGSEMSLNDLRRLREQ